MSLYLGLMSGTSLDGIDVALLSLPTHQLIAGKTISYPLALRDQLMALMVAHTVTVPALFQCHRTLGEVFAQAVHHFLEEFSIARESITAIGCHGQTLLHAPQAEPAYTVQLGCGHTLAARTGLTVVADFRVRDIVLGGQGAPLAPLYHQVLFESLEKPLAILNVGGIANLTLLTASGCVTGYDVGPGNSLLDSWIRLHQGVDYDHAGNWAKTGHVNQRLLTVFLSDPFLALNPPKSLDKGYFSLAWLAQHLTPTDAPQDVQATLVAFTAHCVQRALTMHSVKQLGVCGGGCHNEALMHQLTRCLPGVSVVSTAQLGAPPDYLEAMMIAWLASKTLAGEALSLEAVTGGQKTLLGCIFPTTQA